MLAELRHGILEEHSLDGRAMERRDDGCGKHR